MLKVLRLINRFNLGGPTHNAAYLSRYLSPKYETLLIGGAKSDSEDSSEFILENLGLKAQVIPEMKREINWADDRSAYKKVKQLIKEFKPDIVHTHAAKAGAIGRLAAHNLGVKGIVHTFHGHVFHSYFGPVQTQVFRQIEKYLASKSSAIVAISDRQKEELTQIYRIASQGKTHVIPLGFDLLKFTTDQKKKREFFRKEWFIKDDEMVVSIVGRLVPIKNHELFLRSIAAVLKNSKAKIRALIVGDGESRIHLEKLCKELKLEITSDKNVSAPITFTSWIQDVDYVYAGSDIITLTSLNEGTPVSLIEAQAAGKPIVSTKVGGIENIVEEGKSALLCNSNDLDSFTKNLSTLIENDQKRQQFGNNGAHVLKSFHYSRLAADMETLYDNILGL